VILALSTRNQEISWRLDSPYFRRLGILHKEVENAAQLLVYAIKLQPQVILVSPDLEDMDGFDLCGILRTRPELVHSRVMLVIRKERLTNDLLRRAEHSGAHNVVGVPCSDEELFGAIASSLGLPRRLGRRIRVTIQAELGVEGIVFPGTVRDLGIHGAKVELDDVSVEQVRTNRPVVLRMRRNPGTSWPIEVKATLAWVTEQAEGKALSVGVEFQNLSPELRRAVSELAFWEIFPDRQPVLVFLRGDITETAEFGLLPGILKGPVDFDLSGIRYINSTGVRSWVYFLESLLGVSEYRFVNCSATFVKQASMIPEMLGKGKVLSFHAPYLCESCELEEHRLIQVEEGMGIDELAARQVTCPRCASPMVLDDMPEHLFGFLSSGPVR